MDLLLFILKFIMWITFSYGITAILVDASIFEGVRNWLLKVSTFLGKMIHCRLCTSVWVCFTLSLLVWSPSLFIFISEIVNFKLLESLKIQTTIPASDFDHAISVVAYKSYIYYCSFKAMFADGMIGSTFCWFIYIFEVKLSTK